MAQDVEQPELRRAFNASFTRPRFQNFLHDLNSRLPYPTDFPVSETPLFLGSDFTRELATAASDILSLLRSDGFRQHAASAIPLGMTAPGEDTHPQMLQIDFGVTTTDDGTFVPRLIELQGFPTLYCFQSYFERVIRDHVDIPDGLTTYFNSISRERYLEELRGIIVGDCDTAETILLEIHPERQKTRIDFAATESMLGVKAVCVTKVRKRGTRLFYDNAGLETRIRRIYNRVVFDELVRKRPVMDFSFQDDLDVSWIPHPNWYYRMSKHTLPFLNSPYVPRCTLLSELDRPPVDLSNYVLKPLFSFAGGGVLVDVTERDILAVKEPAHWILQRKVHYTPFVPTEDEPSKAEIRLMFLWKDEPLLVTNLVRMSKGKMMGVDFNKNKSWVGSSIAFFPEGADRIAT